MKCITVLLDGASDRSYKELDYKTPLQYAHTPNLDQLAKKSQCGLMTPLKEGVALGTDLAHFLLFGYPLESYPNRSIIDAIGEGIEMKGNELYLRCSFATVNKDEGFLIESRFTPELSDDEIRQILPELSLEIDEYSFRCVHSYDSHGFIVVQGPYLSANISDSDPFRTDQYAMRVEPFQSEDDSIALLCDAVNEYIKKTYDILNQHPINRARTEKKLLPGNIILTKWAGMYNHLETFYERNGMKGLLLGQSKLLNGLADYLNMTYINYSSFDEAVNMALTSEYDYIHLHTKDPDTASHKKDPLLKVESLEAIDKLLDPLLDFEGLLVVTSDHSTPCSGNAIHSGESVAFMATGDYIRRDSVDRFNEIECARGSVFLTASDFMTYILNASDRGTMYHLRQGREKRHFLLNDVQRLV